jgi:hypothetical protein
LTPVSAIASSHFLWMRGSWSSNSIWRPPSGSRWCRRPRRQAALARDLLALVQQFNRADDGTIAVPGEYLEIVVARR